MWALLIFPDNKAEVQLSSATITSQRPTQPVVLLGLSTPLRVLGLSTLLRVLNLSIPLRVLGLSTPLRLPWESSFLSSNLITLNFSFPLLYLY